MGYGQQPLLSMIIPGLSYIARQLLFVLVSKGTLKPEIILWGCFTEKTILLNDHPVEDITFCVICLAHDLIPFPGRDDVVGQDHVRLPPPPPQTNASGAPMIHVGDVETPSVASDTICLPGNSSTFPWLQSLFSAPVCRYRRNLYKSLFRVRSGAFFCDTSFR